MTIKECIDIVDNIKPNQYTVYDKVMWLSFIDATIINDVLKTHEGYDGRYDLFEGYSEDKLSVSLIVPSPYDRLYTAYLQMKIDSENGETARYNNSAALYNAYMTEYRKYYNKTHMPLDLTKRTGNTIPQKKVTVGLSEAEYENLKRDLYYLLSEYFSSSVSPDKLYDIVTSYAQNNIELLKGKDGEDGKDCGLTKGEGVDTVVQLTSNNEDGKEQSTATGTSSSAFGKNNQASGETAMAINCSNVASAEYTFAAGIGTEASGTCSASFGCGSKATKNMAAAMGYWTTAEGNSSLSLGRYSVAKGSASIAGGIESIAEGDSSVAIGRNNLASGRVSIAGGFKSQATGNAAVAIGEYDVASGANSLALGSLANATGMGSVSISAYHANNANAVSNEATNTCSVAIGRGNKVQGWGSVGLGGVNTVEASHSVAIGTGNSLESTCTESFALGYGLQPSNAKSLVLGRYNKPLTESEIANGESAILQIGAGEGGTNKQKNAFEIRKNSSGELIYRFGSTSITEAQLKKLLALIS